MYHTTYSIFIFFVASLFKTYQRNLLSVADYFIYFPSKNLGKVFFPTENNMNNMNNEIIASLIISIENTTQVFFNSTSWYRPCIIFIFPLSLYFTFLVFPLPWTSSIYHTFYSGRHISFYYISHILHIYLKIWFNIKILHIFIHLLVNQNSLYLDSLCCTYQYQRWKAMYP